MDHETTLMLPGEDRQPVPVRVAAVDMKWEKYHPPGWELMVRQDGPAWQVRLPFPTPQGTHLIYGNGAEKIPGHPHVYGRIGPRQEPKPYSVKVGVFRGGVDTRKEVTWMSPIEGPDHWWQRAEFFNDRNQVVYYLVPAGIPYSIEGESHFVKSHRDEWLKSNGRW